MMRRVSLIWVLICMFAELFGQTTLFDLLCMFRECMVHRPFPARMKTAEQALAHGMGNDVELSLAFQRLAGDCGYETQLVQGTVEMDSQQLAEWLPGSDSWMMIGAHLAENGCWQVPMTWVRCHTGYLPLLYGGCASNGTGIDVFPGLIGCDVDLGGWARLTESDKRQLEDKLVALGDGENPLAGSGEWSRCLGQELSMTLDRQGDMGEPAQVIGAGYGVRGYRSEHLQGLRPVRIVAENPVEEIPATSLGIEISRGGHVLWSGEFDSSSVLSDGVEVCWKHGNVEEQSGAIGQIVLGKRASCSVEIDGKTHLGSEEMLGRGVQVRFRWLADERILSECEDGVLVGERVHYTFSQGIVDQSALPLEADSPSGQLRRLSRELCRRTDRSERLKTLLLGGDLVGGLQVFRAGKRPYGSHHLGELHRIDGYQLVLGGCRARQMGRRWALSRSFGQSLLASEMLLDLFPDDHETCFGAWDDALSLGKDVEFVEDGNGYGIADSAGRLLLHWDHDEQCYDSSWHDRRGSRFYSGVVVMDWPDAFPFQACRWKESFWATCLDLIGSLTASRASMDFQKNCVRDFAHVTVYLAVFRRLMERIRMNHLDIVQKIYESDGTRYVSIDFSGVSMETWELSIQDCSGKSVFQVSGVGSDALITWDGKDHRGDVCPEGEYLCLLKGRNARGVSSRERRFTWDIEPPRPSVQAYLEKSEGGHVLVMHYHVAEAFLEKCQLTVRNASSGTILQQWELSEDNGRLEWPVDSGSSGVCLVELSARDVSGNEGIEQSQVDVSVAMDAGSSWEPDNSVPEAVPLEDVHCALHNPGNGELVLDGILEVTGEFTGALSDVFYQLRLRDGHGRLLPCTEQSADGSDWLLCYGFPAPFQGQFEKQYPIRAVPQGEAVLGKLDLTGLPNGRYCLQVLVKKQGKIGAFEREFVLESDLKLGLLEFGEREGTVRLAGIRLDLYRNYSSLMGASGHGYGWTMSLGEFSAETYDQRMEAVGVDGEEVSLRTGGKRDVTLELPGVGRRTFSFSLQPAGSWSFGYLGRWMSPPGTAWQLRATCDSDVVALPGMEPYWKASGPGVPLEQFDFPGFVLTSPEGVEYWFKRQSYGDYYGLNEDGSSIMTACWGGLFLEKVVMKEGHEMLLEQDAVLLRQADGILTQLLLFQRNEEGQVKSIVFQDGSGTQLHYSFDELGNLCQVHRQRKGEKERLWRTYAYERPDFPHLLTEIRNGAGRVLSGFTFDAQGRLIGVENGRGGQVSAQRDAFRRMEVRTDENGIETVCRFDRQGKLVEEVHGDGGVVSYVNDSSGNRCERIDELGRKTTWTYDSRGRMTSRRNPLGAVTKIAYDQRGNWNAMTDALGRSFQSISSQDGLKREILFPQGGGIKEEKDAEGRLTSMSMSGSMNKTFSFQYLNDGTGIVSDGEGEQLEMRETENGEVTQAVYRWVDTETGETMEVYQESMTDSEGRLLYVADDRGNSIEYERDDAGRILSETHSNGFWKRFRYDVTGKCSEELWSTGQLRRTAYTAGGLVLMSVGPEIFPLEMALAGQELEFVTGKLFSYDACGRPVVQSHRLGVRMGRRELGGGAVECSVIDEGVEGSRDLTEYDLHGQIVRQCSSSGAEERRGYDLAGRLAWSEDGSGNRTTYERDLAGRMTAQTDPAGRRTEWTYDRWDNLAERRDADGRVHEYLRNLKGTVTEEKATGETPKCYRLNEQEQIVAVTMADVSCEMNRDRDGLLTSLKDGRGNLVQFERDSMGRVLRETSAEGRTTRWGFEAGAATASWRIDGAGRKEEVRRGMDGQVLSTTWIGGDGDCLVLYHSPEGAFSLESKGEIIRREEWFQDVYGNPVRMMVNGEKSLGYQYDLRGRLTGSRSAVTDIRQHYGSEGRVECVEYLRAGGIELGETWKLCRIYDALGRISRETVGERWRQTDYDSMGRIRRLTYGQGQVLHYQADYAFDDAGRRIGLLEGRLKGEQWQMRAYAWTYDEQGRLTGESWGKEGSSVPEFSWKGSYDRAGNLVEEEWITSTGKRVSFHEFDRDNCLLVSHFKDSIGTSQVQYEWDGSGCLVREECSGVESWSRVYEWDCRGKLKRVVKCSKTIKESVTFHYDCEGGLRGYDQQREGLGVNTETQTIELNQDRLMGAGLPRVLDYRLRGGDDSAHTVIHGQMPLALLGKEEIWLQYNGHGGLVSGQEGDCVQDAWGQVQQGTLSDGPGYCGEWFESMSGLVYLRNRFYCPRLRRFISPDSIRGAMDDPRSFNRYSYCLNDPLNRIDPTGLFSMLSLLSSIGTMAVKCYLVMTPVLVVDQLWVMSEVNEEISARKPKWDEATVIIHGVGFHEKGWARPLLNGLQAVGVKSHDFYEHRWKGYSFAYMDTFIPRKLSHALNSVGLACCILDINAKGYEKLNVISHSWGTMLSRGVLTLLIGLDVGGWVTMGSPLCIGGKPFCVDDWMNIYNIYDPIIHLAEDLFFMGYNCRPIGVFKQSFQIEQRRIIAFNDPHSCYWGRPDVWMMIRNLLRK